MDVRVCWFERAETGSVTMTRIRGSCDRYSRGRPGSVPHVFDAIAEFFRDKAHGYLFNRAASLSAENAGGKFPRLLDEALKICAVSHDEAGHFAFNRIV